MANMKSIIAHIQHNIAKYSITPGGSWEFNIELNKKQAINANRQGTERWEDYPDDNMGVAFIEKFHNLLVVDIDSEPILHQEDQSIFIPSLNITLPPTLTTTTSKEGRYFYLWQVI